MWFEVGNVRNTKQLNSEVLMASISLESNMWQLPPLTSYRFLNIIICTNISSRNQE